MVESQVETEKIMQNSRSARREEKRVFETMEEGKERKENHGERRNTRRKEENVLGKKNYSGRN